MMRKQQMVLLLFILVPVLLLLPFSCLASFPSRFDPYFKIYSRDFDWKLLKAQCYQESLLDPYAISPVGAMGLCQFMPGTWKDMPVEGSPFNPIKNIRAAAYYMGWLRSTWSAPRPDFDRHSLALASYNAGLGNLLKAQKACQGKNLWCEIYPCLPQITGENANETLHYVPQIWKFYRQLSK